MTTLERIRAVVEDEERSIGSSAAVADAYQLDPTALRALSLGYATEATALRTRPFPTERDPAGDTIDREGVVVANKIRHRTESEREADYRRYLRICQASARLQEAAEHADRRVAEEHRAVLLARARETGEETCDCGETHHPGADYWASRIRDWGTKTELTVMLAGPFPTHIEAIAALPAAQLEAERREPRAAWDAYGTCATHGGHQEVA